MAPRPIPYLPSYRSQGQLSVFSYRANTATGTTPNNATFANGERLRLAPQFYYYRGSFGFLGEYTQVKQDVSRTVGGVTLSDTLTNTAWQGQFSWFITGEEESFRGFTPGSTFQPGKPGSGAWELVARIQELDVDDDAFVGRRQFLRESADRDHQGNIVWRRRELVPVEHREAVTQLRPDQLRRRCRHR